MERYTQLSLGHAVIPATLDVELRCVPNPTPATNTNAEVADENMIGNRQLAADQLHKTLSDRARDCRE